MNDFSRLRSGGHGPAVLAAVAIGWATAVVVAALSGMLTQLGLRFMPGYALLVASGIAVPTFAWHVSETVRRAVDAVGLHRLTLMHVWRVPAALVFFWYGSQGLLPTAFWVLAGVGDLLAGLYAATLLRGERSLERYRNVHRFGLADFVVAVGTGLTFTLIGDERMVLLTTLPMALIPLFGVGLSGASHVISLAVLGRERAATKAARALGR